ncbi:Cobalt-zinc-cadmium resistance protein CzcC precursor [Botrimarina colliarenosi]|uniref:Cobalt-zinc-cadmium resistance protein CzcC n=1 Tax=Botrimarina colliarenosi TaxID=2528001 RepID=A0A5C6AFC7_9BACT|nr:TolC family protein [Botrimarina colliarenosi]TWT98140.1 Cobalt-zinc-cadmium resistance protein CzcC precursor [Botrimarina colliarenosi]
MSRFLLVATLALFAIAAGAAAQEQRAPLAAVRPSTAGKSFTPPPAIPPAPVEELKIDVSQEENAVGPVYTLDELLTLAAQNNPTLRQAQLHISAGLAKAQQAGLYPNPVFTYQAEQIGVDSETDTDTPGEFHGGVLEQRFVTAGKLRLSREKYLRRAHVSEHLATAQQFRVCNDVRLHFYRALAAGETLAIRRELLKSAEDAAVTSQEAYNMGQARRPEVRRANVTLQRARLDLLSAENAQRERFRTLASLIGVTLAEGRVEGSLMPERKPASFAAELGRLLANSPEVAAARAKLAVDRMTVQRERVEWTPDIVARGGAGYNFESGETVAVAGIALEVPIYNRNQGTIRQAQSDYARQQQEVRRVEFQLQNRLATAYQLSLTALQHAHEYERVILPESKAAYAELLESYKRDRVDWPDVLMAQHDYLDAKLTQVENLLEARTYEVLIAGYLLHDGLMAAEDATPPGHIDATPRPR